VCSRGAEQRGDEESRKKSPSSQIFRRSLTSPEGEKVNIIIIFIMYDGLHKVKINNIYSLLQLFPSAFICMTFIWSTIQPTTVHALNKLIFKPSRLHFSLCKNSFILSFGKGSIDAMEQGSSNRPHKKSKTEVVLKETKMDPEERIGSSAPLLVHEGVFAVHKPLEWTSNNVVGYIRKMLERDAKERGYVLPQKRGRKPLIKCGHGGTLDPLATGVLVIGIGRGTKVLQE